MWGLLWPFFFNLSFDSYLTFVPGFRNLRGYHILTVCVFCLLIESSLSMPTKGSSLETTERSYSFAGYKFQDHEWIRLKEVIGCWANTGKWLLNSTINYWDLMLSTEENIQVASPCFNPLLKSLKVGMRGSYYTNNPPSRCENVLSSDVMKYEWNVQPDMCSGFDVLQPFSLDRLCSIMEHSSITGGYGNIMIVGDSMSEQFSRHLLNLMFAGHHQNMTYKKCGFHGDPVIMPCSESALNTTPGHDTAEKLVLVYTKRNDYLTLDLDRDKSGEALGLKIFPWVDVIASANISLLVLNRGAHYVEDAVLISELNTTLSYLQSNHPEVSILWRTTPYGHLDFAGHEISPPLSFPLRPDQLQKYNYESFERQNQLVVSLLQEHYPEVLVLDVFPSTVLRQDSHINPLHYCTPSHLNNWVIMFYNILRLVSEFSSSAFSVSNSYGL